MLSMESGPAPYDPASQDSLESRLAALAKAARQGDEHAFAELYESLSPALYTWADYRLGSRGGAGRADPWDLVQETWCRAWRRIEAFDPAHVPIRAWLFRIAKNIAMENLRRARSARPDGAGPTTRQFAMANLPDSVTAVSQRLMRQEELSSFRTVLEGLEEHDRRLALHCGLEGLPHAEVATRLDLSTAAVGKRWQRLRKRLVEQGLPETLVTPA